MSSIISIQSTGSGYTRGVHLPCAGTPSDYSRTEEILFGETLNISFSNISAPWDLYVSLSRGNISLDSTIHCEVLRDDNQTSSVYRWVVEPFEFETSQNQSATLQLNDSLTFFALEQSQRADSTFYFTLTPFLRVVEQRAPSAARVSAKTLATGFLLGMLAMPTLIVGW